jgi:hypothetical protein
MKPSELIEWCKRKAAFERDDPYAGGEESQYRAIIELLQSNTQRERNGERRNPSQSAPFESWKYHRRSGTGRCKQDASRVRELEAQLSERKGV